MKRQSRDRHATGNAVAPAATPTYRARAARLVGIRRLGARARAMFARIPRPASDAVSIEEAIARFVTANPTQLYRGGA